jgi:glycosyltransferase involved in cell wall biosynthesis
MRRRGHSVLVVASYEKNPLSVLLQGYGIEVVSLGALRRSISLFNDLMATLRLLWIFFRKRPDLVSLHNSKSGVIGRLVCKLLGIPCVFTAHGWAFTSGVPRLRARIYLKIERLLSRFSSIIITVSDYDKRLGMRAVSNKARIVTIHNGVGQATTETVTRNPLFPLRLTMIGRFTSQKDHRCLFEALSKIPKSLWYLDLIGTGPNQSQVKKMCAQANLLENVTFVGQVYDVTPYLRRSDIYLLISNWEGLPRSIIEATRESLPVIASRVGGVSELVQHGVNGYLVRRGDANELTCYLNLLLRDATHRASLGRNGKILYDEKFSFNAMFLKTFKIYEMLISESLRP